MSKETDQKAAAYVAGLADVMERLPREMRRGPMGTKGIYVIEIESAQADLIIAELRRIAQDIGKQ